MMTAHPKYSALTWRTSSASGGVGECVEVATADSFVLVRDSRNQSGIALMLTSAQWADLLRRIRGGPRA